MGRRRGEAMERNDTLNIRITSELKNGLRSISKHRKLTLSSFVEYLLLKAVPKNLKNIIESPEMVVVVERRVVYQEWYETELTRTGWGSYGWIFEDGCPMEDKWEVVKHIAVNRFNNPTMGIAEREVSLC